MQMPIFLSHPTARCDLTVPGREHILLALRLQNEPEGRKYLGRYMPIGEKQEEEWFAKANSAPNDAVFMITLKDEPHTAIGMMGLHQIDWKNRRAITGAVILREHCNKGIGSSAKMLLLKWAFDDLGLNKIESRTIAFNGRSVAYSLRCGYREIGRLRQHHFRCGKWNDEIILEVYGREWRKLWKKFEAGTFHKKA